REVPLRTEAVASLEAPRLTYRGGALLPSVQVFLFFWSAWQQDPQLGLVQQVNDFFEFVLTSPLMDQMAEYSVQDFTIGPGARTGAIVLTTAPPATVQDAAIQQLIQEEIASDPAVSQPTSNSLYYVFLPPGVTVDLEGS